MAKYSKGASKKVERAMHEMKEGKLTSGKSGKKVKSRKQAIAIGLSEAREVGAKVPGKKTASKKATAKKSTAQKAPKKATPKVAGKKQTAKKTITKKSAAKKLTLKTAPKKAAAKKSSARQIPSKKTASKNTPSKKASTKRSASQKSNASFTVERPRQSAYTNIPEVNDAVHSEHRMSTDQSENSMEQREHLDFIPDKFRITPQDPYHGHTEQSRTKSKVKPSGKKPLWNNNKK